MERVGSILKYTGPYTMDQTGEEKEAQELELECVEILICDPSVEPYYEPQVIALPPGTDATDEAEVHWETLTVCIDLSRWEEQECEQGDGHNFINHQWSEEPESAVQICTHCGKEIDPA